MRSFFAPHTLSRLLGLTCLGLLDCLAACEHGSAQLDEWSPLFGVGCAIWRRWQFRPNRLHFAARSPHFGCLRRAHRGLCSRDSHVALRIGEIHLQSRVEHGSQRLSFAVAGEVERHQLQFDIGPSAR